MESMKSDRIQLNTLRDKLNKMLENNDGKINEDIVKVSQALDVLVLEEMEKHNYNKKK